MKNILSLLLTAIMMIASFPNHLYAEEKKSYTEIFKQDSVIDVKIDIDTADLEDIRKYPQNEEYHSADITVDGIKIENAGIRTKGNMTLKSVSNSESERYSYRIKFNKYVKGNKLLGLDELCLNNGYSDASYMREYLHYEVLRKLGMNVPETVFCNVYINDEYAGFYLAVEGLDNTFLEDNFGENYKKGNFYKMDEGASLEYKEDENYTYADLKSGDDSDLTSFKEFVKELNDTETGEKGKLEKILDVDSALKYIASNTILCNYDSYNGNMHHNYYLYENEDGKFTVVPWDFNMSFGGFNGNNSEVGIDTPFISGSLETLPLINKLISVPEYKEKYYEYINEIIDILSNFEDRVSELKSIISPYVKNDTTSFYTYEDFDKATASQGNGSKTEISEKNEGSNHPDNAHKPFGGNSSIIDCISDRIANIQAQFDGTASKTTESANRHPGGGRGDRPGTPPNGNQVDNPPQMPDTEFDTMPPNFPPNSTDGEPPQMPEGQFPFGDGSEPPTPPDGNMNPDNSNRPNRDDKHEFGGDNGHMNNRYNTINSPIRVHLDGHILAFDSDPYIKNDSTLVGFRAILEALGAEVDWNEKKCEITAVKGDTEIKLTIGSEEAYVNNEKYELPVSPEITNDSTMVPIRFISEQLGMKVNWDGTSKLITITSK